MEVLLVGVRRRGVLQERASERQNRTPRRCAARWRPRRAGAERHLGKGLQTKAKPNVLLGESLPQKGPAR